jgi:hypothetical protein
MIRRAGVPGFLLVACAVLLATPAQAAVRDCADFVEHTSGGQTEKAAKTSALDGWMKKVETLGMEQVRWQMAADRSLQCTSSSAGKIQCVARARPCVVKQVAPEGWRPQYPRDRQ